jgi:hypothetical protein
MNHRFRRNDVGKNYWITSWDLGIIHDNGKTLYHTVYYDYEVDYYYVYERENSPEITEYLVSNNICTLRKYKQNNTISKLIINPHVALELI